MADDIRDLMPTLSRAPYQVNLYVDHCDLGRERSRVHCVHTQQCCDELQARNFAINMLLSIYLDLIYPHRDDSGQRLLWCELVPGRWVNGRWERDPRAGGAVDAAYLDSAHGSITFDLAASVRRWRPLQAVRRG